MEEEHLSVLDRLPKSIYRFDKGVLHLNIVLRRDVINAVTGEYDSYRIKYMSRTGGTEIEMPMHLDNIQYDVIEVLSQLLEGSYQVLNGIILNEIIIEEN